MCAHVPVCLCAVTHTWRSETTCRSWFSLITVWIPGGELGVVCVSAYPRSPPFSPLDIFVEYFFLLICLFLLSFREA